MLLAVDLGLQTAWSVWDSEGRLVRYESRHFPNRTKFKSGVGSICRSLPPIDVVVAEGDARLAKVWFSFSKEWETELVQAHDWRPFLLPERERRSGSRAKRSAVVLATKIAANDQTGRAPPLGDDTAEAILLGYWAVRQRGWRYPGPNEPVDW